MTGSPVVYLRPIDMDPAVPHPEYKDVEAVRYLNNLSTAEFRRLKGVRVTCHRQARFTLPIEHPTSLDEVLSQLKDELKVRGVEPCS